MKVDFLKAFFARFRRNIILLVVLSAGMILTLSVFLVIKNNNYKEMRERFTNYSLARYKLITSLFDKNFTDAEVIANFYRSSQKVEKDEFKTFVEPMLSKGGGAGACFIWIPCVKEKERKDFEKQIRKETGNDFEIWNYNREKARTGQGVKDFYLPILFIEPHEEFNTWFGVEMSSDSTAYRSMLKLFDGKTVRSVDIKDYSQQEGIVTALRVFIPIYQPEVNQSSGPGRQNLIGFVLAWYSVTKQLKQLFKDTPSFEINFDISAVDPLGNRKNLYSHYPGSAGQLTLIEKFFNDNYGLIYSGEYTVKEMVFKFTYRASADFIRNNASYAHWALLGFGLALNFMLFIITYRLLYRKERAEALVLEMTKELRESERTANTLLNASPDLILLMDLKGNIQACNEVSADSLSQRKSEIIGKNFFLLLENFQSDSRKVFFNKSIHSGMPVHFEDEYNGDWFDCGFFPIEDEFGRIERVAFFSHNITERKNNEKKEREYSRRIEIISNLERLILLKRRPERIYPFFFSALGTFYNSDHIFIALFEGGNGAVDILSKKGDDKQSGFANEKIPFDEFMSIGLRLSPGAVIKNYSSPPEGINAFWDKYLSAGITSIAAIPLQTEEKISGFIVLMNKELNSYIIGNIAFAQDMTATLAIALEQDNLVEQNKRHAVELENKVNERTSELAEVNKELEAFSYSVSHDLRAPLRVIDGYSRVLFEDYEGSLDETAKQFLEKITTSTGKMASLIEDMLKLSRISRLTLIKEDVDLSRMIEDIMHDLKESEPERNAELEIQQGLMARGDYRLIRIAMENLLGNAWKFTSKKDTASIKFGLLDVNKEKYYFISDNGAGFDMNYSDRLFGAFQRLHTPGEFPGTGIGLSIVQRIIKRHNGKIWAESKIDSGSTFYFSIS